MRVKAGIENGRMPYAPTETPGFRVALPPEADQPKAEAIASLPGMTIKFANFSSRTLDFLSKNRRDGARFDLSRIQVDTTRRYSIRFGQKGRGTGQVVF